MRAKQPEPRYLAVGRVQRPHGVRGELKLEALTDYPEHLANVAQVYIGSRYRAYTLLHVRMHGKALLLQVKECTDRNTAETLRGQFVHIALTDAIPLEEDEYYHYQVVGLQVKTDTDEILGEIVDVFESPNANDVFVVHGSAGEILLPAINDVILDLDFEAGWVLVHLLPGLLGDE